jgi:hypothetical protein
MIGVHAGEHLQLLILAFAPINLQVMYRAVLPRAAVAQGYRIIVQHTHTHTHIYIYNIYNICLFNCIN